MRVLVALIGAFSLLGAGAAYARVVPDPGIAFTISDSRVTESSGLALSTRHPGVVYTHNDSGGSAAIYAIGPDGRTRATLTVSRAYNRDWEGIAVGRDQAGPAIFVGDIGDNAGGAQPYVTVYRVPEPARLADQTLAATAFRLKYEDGPRNAESLLVNPRTNRLYIASKQFGGGLYEAPANLRADRVNVLRRVGAAPLLATDGAYAPDGRHFVIRTYYAAHIYSAPGRLLRIVSLPNQEQGESITYSADGHSLLAGSEGPRSPVYRVPLPGDASSEPGSAASSPPAAAGDPAARSDGSGVRSAVLLGVVAIGGFFAYRRLRGRS
ncbi:hypothetical protein [Actinomadura alba]|nr:hypothetical protein [Actinomadura alba]